jgi:hypothetical protein
MSGVRSLSGGLCCKTLLLSSAGVDLSIAQLLVFSALPYRETRLADRLRGTGDWRRRRRAAEELDEAPQILSGCSQ